MAKKKGKFNGFTLIELLVVISIIAILMAIMMPALSKAREQARRMMCLTQQKDMGTMLSLYVADNNGRMVSSSGYLGHGHTDSGRWWDRLGLYYGKTTNDSGENRYRFQVFMCPTQWNKTTAARLGPGYPTANLKSDGTIDLGPAHMYPYNLYFHCPINKDTGQPTFSQYWWTRFSQIQTPSTLPVFWDGDIYRPAVGGNNNYGDPHWSLYEHNWVNGQQNSRRHTEGGPAANHGKNINYLFADGHASAMGLLALRRYPNCP